MFVPMAAGLVVVTFSLMLLIPGDPVQLLLGQEAAPEQVAQLRSILRLDDPWPERLARYFNGLLHGDLGQSIFQNAPVAQIVAQRLAATVELAVTALILAVIIGVTLGVIAAATTNLHYKDTREVALALAVSFVGAGHAECASRSGSR